MGEKKIKRYLSPKQLSEQGIVSWSSKTIERRIKEDGLPAIKDVSGWLIDLDDLDNWMKQRKQYA